MVKLVQVDSSSSSIISYFSTREAKLIGEKQLRCIEANGLHLSSCKVVGDVCAGLGNFVCVDSEICGRVLFKGRNLTVVNSSIDCLVLDMRSVDSFQEIECVRSFVKAIHVWTSRKVFEITHDDGAPIKFSTTYNGGEYSLTLLL